MAMTLISSQTLSGSVASVTFSSIPQTYKTLRLLISSRSDTAGIGSTALQLNGSTAAVVSRRHLDGDGSSATSGSATGSIEMYIGEQPSPSQTANTFSSISVEIPNYAGSTAKVTSTDAVSENNGTTAHQMLLANLSTTTTAVTSLLIRPWAGSANFVSGSTFTLYGLS